MYQIKLTGNLQVDKHDIELTICLVLYSFNKKLQLIFETWENASKKQKVDVQSEGGKICNMKIEEVLQPLVQIHSGGKCHHPLLFFHPKPRELISKPVFSWVPIFPHLVISLTNTVYSWQFCW